MLLGLAGRHDHVVASTRDARTNRAHAHIGNFRRFLVGVAQYLGEDERFSTIWVEGVEKHARVDKLCPVRRSDTGSGIFKLHDGLSRARHVVADVVDPHATGKGKQPSFCGGTRRKTREGAHHAEVGFPREIVGNVAATEMGEEAPDIALGEFDELTECRAVATSSLECKAGDVVVGVL